MWRARAASHFSPPIYGIDRIARAAPLANKCSLGGTLGHACMGLCPGTGGYEMVKTLIVDDSAVFRRSMRQMLASRFRYMRIAEAATLREAVLQANALRSDLVFVDVRLPDGNGLDLPGLLAPTLPQSRVCIVTSFDLPEYRSAARASGAWHFLAKGGSTSAEVVAVVEATLSHRLATLVVDDNAPRRARVVESLAVHWPVMMVFEAANLRSALAMAPVVRPELVLARLGLLTASGPGLSPAIKAIRASATVVALGHALQPRHRAAALHCGADHVVEWRSGIDDDIAAIMNAVLSRRDDAPRRQPAP
jgi:DNA-binding NarL/FixJ family response regulator